MQPFASERSSRQLVKSMVMAAATASTAKLVICTSVRKGWLPATGGITPPSSRGAKYRGSGLLVKAIQASATAAAAAVAAAIATRATDARHRRAHEFPAMHFKAVGARFALFVFSSGHGLPSHGAPARGAFGTACRGLVKALIPGNAQGCGKLAFFALGFPKSARNRLRVVQPGESP